MSRDDETRPIPAAEPAAKPANADAPATEQQGHIRVVQPPVYAEPKSGQRVGTVVWGLVVAAIGVGLLAIAWGANLDAELALIVLLGAAGVALLVGSLLGMRRSRAREEGRG